MVEEPNWTTTVAGTTPDFFEIRDWHVAKGSFFGDSDLDSGAKVIIFKTTISEETAAAPASIP